MPAFSDGKPPSSPNTIIFLDDRWIARQDDLARAWHQPSFVAESRLAAGVNRWGCSFPGVSYDPLSRTYRLWYVALIGRGGRQTWPVLYGESPDGWHFKPSPVAREKLHPDSPVRQGEGWPDNVVFASHTPGHDNFGRDVVCEPNETDAGRRFRMVYNSSPSGWAPGQWFNALAFSPDGFNWTPHPELKVHSDYSDTCHLLRHNRQDGQYQIVCRPGPAVRSVAMVRSSDLKQWDPPKVILAADAQDSPSTQLYGMPAFEYQGLWIGLLWVMRTPPQSAGAATGEMDVQLAFSHDGIQWNRGPRQAFIPVREKGQYGHGAIEASSLLVDADGTIRIYACGFVVDHALVRQSMKEGRPPSEMLAYRLRPDGFAGLRAERSTATVVLKPMQIPGDTLLVNCTAAEDLRVELRDADGKPIPGYGRADCAPIGGDQVAARVAWKSARTCAEWLVA